MADRRIGDRYVLHKKILAGDPSRGVPELWLAYDAGDTYYVKLWRRKGEDNADIRALWNREVQSLTRLQGYPGADEMFVRLYDLHFGDRHYYAVLDGGRRSVLSEMLQSRARYPWLLNLGEVGRRRSLWEGLLRISEALSILHGEGTLHRSLSTSAIFAGPDGHGDFRLSGFEWSLRIAGNEGAAAKVGHRSTLRAPELDRAEGEFSPATDWFDFGLVAAECFGIPVRTVKKRGIARTGIENLSHLRDSERSAILDLLAEDPEDRLAKAEDVTQYIREIVRDLSSATTGAGRRLTLAVRLGPAVDLSRAIRTASEDKALPDDPIRQRAWIEHDLRGDIRITARVSPYPHMILRGAKLEYRVTQWSVGGLITWDIGYCESVEFAPKAVTDDQYYSLGGRNLQIQTYPDVRKTLQTIRDRSAEWDKIFPFRSARRQVNPHVREIHDFFRITQALDTVLTAAQIFPVEILDINRSSNETEVEVTPVEEPDRNDLASHLGLDTPSRQLRDWFRLGADPVAADDEDEPERDRYRLLSRRTIDSDASPVDWHFVEARPHPNGPRYRFRCSQGVVSVRQGRAYLARNHDGTLAQIRRRHKAIEDLRSHENVLRLLNDPRAESWTTNDALPGGRAEIPLDPSKLKVLELLWQRQPSFSVQGPPGTGKTTLIEAFSDRLFATDPSAQILVTAHSHHTVDVVRRKLAELFAKYGSESAAILVRLGAKEPTEHDIAPVTERLLQQLQASDLLSRAPVFLRNKLQGTLSSVGSRDDGASTDLRTMQLLVQDAANVTFVTSNSGELAELAARGRRFDWSIIEEAGKAHGFDMAAALQESHRLLLIGDHNQLPPFNARLYRDLLGDPLRVRKAITAGAQFAPGLVDRSIVDEEEVTLFGVLFQRSLGVPPDGLGPAATLTDQYRCTHISRR